MRRVDVFFGISSNNSWTNNLVAHKMRRISAHVTSLYFAHCVYPLSADGGVNLTLSSLETHCEINAVVLSCTASVTCDSNPPSILMRLIRCSLLLQFSSIRLHFESPIVYSTCTNTPFNRHLQSVIDIHNLLISHESMIKVYIPNNLIESIALFIWK